MLHSINGHAPPVAPVGQLEALLVEYPFLRQLLAAKSPAGSERTVREIVQLYLADAVEDLCPDAYANRRRDLERFAAAFGDRRVAECTKLDLRSFLASHPQLACEWSRNNAIASVRRCFSWACDMGQIPNNPFHGMRCRQGRPRREMFDHEFQAILRHATPCYRRALLFLRWTGCRPCEMIRLTWKHIRWEQRIAVLSAREHKTGKKTGKPRVLVLNDQAVKLLRWLQRNTVPPAIEAMRRILAGGPLSARLLQARMRQAGFSYRSQFLARRAIGVVHRRLGRGRGSVYQLPPQQTLPGPADYDRFIFLNSRGKRWGRHELARNLTRLRQRAGVPMEAKQYGLRHRFGTNGVKSGLNLLALAALMGHSKVTTTQGYVHVEDDVDFLQQAVHQVTGYRPAPKGGAA